MVDNVQQVLGENGIFAQRISNFMFRDAQLELAEAIESHIEHTSTLVAEAGTGTGKTYAYLVPAILSNKKVLISTGTKALQDQLFFQDLPNVMKLVRPNVKVALLKGRANYLCLYRFNTLQESGRLTSRHQVKELNLITKWSLATKQGDIAEVAGVDESAEIWPEVTSTNDNCQGSDCPFYEDCYLVLARRRAMESDIVVVNHHLFFADVALKDTGFGELLPSREVFIFDEAHQLAHSGHQYFGTSFTSRKVNELCKDLTLEYYSHAKDCSQLLTGCHQLEKALADCRLAIPEHLNKDEMQRLYQTPAFMQNLQLLQQQLHELNQVVEVNAERSAGLENCQERIEDLLAALTVILGQERADYVKWFECYRKGFGLFVTPLSIAEPFSAYRNNIDASWIFTSATLTVDRKFAHLNRELGLAPNAELILESPFDYQKQGILYMPRYLPDPNHPNFLEALYQQVLPVLKASQGRAFLLFTSYRALHWFAEKLEQERLDFPILVQGDASKIHLLDSFKRKANAILLGTASFWEGVDVQGEQLSLVVIDKLPFGSPGDPVLKAKVKQIRGQGGNPFYELQMQQAVLMLKQGAGRLIRGEQDSGVLMIGDPRIIAMEYGQVFVNSLPQMRRTRQLAVVEQFFTPEQTLTEEKIA